MMRPAFRFRSRHSFVAAILAICMAIPFSVAPAAHAGSRSVDAVPPVAVTYHILVVFSGGPTAGTTFEGAVSGMLDSTGVLTATAVTAMGETAAISGTVGTAAAPAAALMLQTPSGMFTLSGAPDKAGVWSGTLAAADSQDVLGAWLMTPETVPHSYGFAGRVTAGPDRGTVLSGTLATVAASAKSTAFDATYISDDGPSYGASGSRQNGLLMVSVWVKGMGQVAGTGLKSVQTVLGTKYITFNGTFVGPRSGDSGQWSASVTS